MILNYEQRLLHCKSGYGMFKKDQVFNVLKSRIICGEYLPGYKLPGESELAASLGVSRITLRSALKMLQDNGMISIRNRSGSYVLEQSGGKKYLAVVTGEDIDHIRISSMCQVQELHKVLALHGDELELVLNVELKKTLSLNQWQRKLIQGRIAGIFVCSHSFVAAERNLMMLNHSGLPVVQLEGTRSDRNIHDFPMALRNMPEVFAGGVKHLCLLGHQRIATLFAWNDMRGFNAKSYQKFLEDCNIGQAYDLVRYFKKKSNIPQIVRKMMKSSKPPTAFMCFCDSSAKLVIETLAAMGYCVPEDVSVMGICGYLERLFITPPLSVVNFHYDIAVQEAVQIMYRANEWFGSGEIITRMIPFSVIPRGSTARVSKNIKTLN